MGTCDENSSALKPQDDLDLGFTSSDSGPHVIHSTLVGLDPVSEEALLQGFLNVGLTETENENENENESENEKINGAENDNEDFVAVDEGSGSQHPLRPYAEDCPFYLRTGTCKFGSNCKFNHPVRRVNQVGKERDNEREGSLEKTGLVECKYYLTSGGCKFGKACRYNHSKETAGIAAPPSELNFLGLPIRLGEKECPFYMRNGSCGYGANCRFHHPNPTAVGGSDHYNSSPNSESVGGFSHSSENHIGESIPLHLLGASQPAVASWSSHMIPNKTVPHLDNLSSYVPVMHSLPQGMHPNPEWNGYQAPIYPQERTRHPHSAPPVNNLMKKADVLTHQQIQFEEFPERPGQPECEYFMNTGDCKYRSACRYHHPKSRVSNSPVCVLSDKGLPLRPDRKICWHYEQHGICKYGRTCLFDHPVNHGSSAFPVGSVLGPTSGSNSWRD